MKQPCVWAVEKTNFDINGIGQASISLYSLQLISIMFFISSYVAWFEYADGQQAKGKPLLITDYRILYDLIVCHTKANGNIGGG